MQVCIKTLGGNAEDVFPPVYGEVGPLRLPSIGLPAKERGKTLSRGCRMLKGKLKIQH